MERDEEATLKLRNSEKPSSAPPLPSAYIHFHLRLEFLKKQPHPSAGIIPTENPSSETPSSETPLFFAPLRDLCGFAVNSPIQGTTKRTKPYDIKEAD